MPRSAFCFPVLQSDSFLKLITGFIVIELNASISFSRRAVNKTMASSDSCSRQSHRNQAWASRWTDAEVLAVSQILWLSNFAPSAIFAEISVLRLFSAKYYALQFPIALNHAEVVQLCFYHACFYLITKMPCRMVVLLIRCIRTILSTRIVTLFSYLVRSPMVGNSRASSAIKDPGPFLPCIFLTLLCTLAMFLPSI